ncbi:CIA30 family protein [Winogradskyella flava]|uniref:CIA30 family protein n=1 Tax=Winogradskyella flava TaxID=1884876 RepID=A0A842IUY9_9FLAO|nr:CIA30 family protein [Winogradskyella flava]MBC2845734.1 CIA30 family protein [Winogradskyella flava]
MTLFNFNSDSDISSWRILDDVVMGGRSDGHFKINSDGHGEYTGDVSLENNGGFSSLRYYFETVDATEYSKFNIRIKGDGKTYQFRVKDNDSDRHSYIYEFDTTADWQTIEIPFDKMYASFRGYRLDIPNFKGQQMEEIAFLIGNKKEESFKLLIDTIILE